MTLSMVISMRTSFHLLKSLSSHTPWVEQNIPIPPSIYDKVCKIIHMKMDASIYKHSNSSYPYHSCWICIAKKEAEALFPVHSLEPLNAFTI